MNLWSRNDGSFHQAVSSRTEATRGFLGDVTGGSVAALGMTVALALLVPLVAIRAQALTVERIFASSDFRARGPGAFHWLENGDAYTVIEPSPGAQGGADIVRYATGTGAKSVLVSVAQLTPRGAGRPLDVEEYSWSTDGKKLLVFTRSHRVWRENTRGDYWVLDLGDGSLRQLGKDAPPSTLMFAKFSPDGTRAAYVSRNDIYVEDLGTGAVTRLTSDGSAKSINGTSDWVYEEEFGLRDGFRWSPDGTRIAFWHLDDADVAEYTLINTTDSLYPKITRYPYPKAGTTNPAARLAVIAATGGAPRWIDLPGDPREHYIPWMEWTTSSNQIALQYLNRLQNEDQLIVADALSGRVDRVAATLRDSAWVDVVGDFTWLKAGKEFLWVSEESGWRQAYAVSLDGSSRRAVTSGHDLISVEAVDEAGGWLYYMASPENATQRYLYRVPLAGAGRAERLTPAGEPGTHSYLISPNAKWAFHSYSTFDRPPVHDVVRLPDHRVERVLFDNAELADRVATVLRRGEFFQVPAGAGVTLDGWMIRPAHFDSTRRYPVLVTVYGEPAGQTVLDSWGGSTRLWHQMLADLGYLVVSFDNRGTPAPKGRAWRKVVYGAVGVLASEDQAAALRTLGIRRGYVDTTRVAVWGWSGGGSMTLNLMFRHPELYSVGMAVAPVPDQHLYDTIYQERYMSTPELNPDGYRLGSPITFAEGLRGRLLIAHGSGDDNVHMQGTERLINRLVELNKPFDFMMYPNRTHGIYEGKNTTVHVYSLLTRYLTEHLTAGGR
ncbi:MAG: S9 family peptidase [Gemmatimonadota bacterium]